MRMLSLCSGIGGIDLAATWAGIEIAGQVEIDPFCCTVLEKRFPDVPRLHDIREIRGDEFGRIDLVAGGIPCQPFSLAGKRGGTADDRHLWPYAFAIIAKARPSFVLIENVTGFISLALDLVSFDLESADYTCRALVLPACAAGAPHIRERVFVVAYTASPRQQVRGYPTGVHHRFNPSGSESMADPFEFRQPAWWPELPGQRGTLQPDGCGASCNRMAHANSVGDAGETSPITSGQRSSLEPAGVRRWEDRASLADTDRPGQQECHITPVTGRERLGSRCVDEGRQYRQTECRLGRNFDGLSAGVDGHHWPALPGEQQYKGEPPRTITGRQADRNKRLKALGNAVVPQQVYPVLKGIVDSETIRWM